MASIMELMRELKHLQALRQAGQLTPDAENRLKDFRAILDANMPKGAPRPATATPAATPATRPPPAAPAPAEPRGMAAGGFQATAIGFGDEPRGNPNAFQIALDPRLTADLDAVAAKADAALKASKPRAKARDADGFVEQLQEINRTNAYTATNTAYLQDDYYSVGDGVELVPDAPVELPLIDPREQDLARLQEAMGSMAGEGTPIMPGGVFLDDFLELYTSGLLTTDPLEDEDEADSNDPTLLIPGRRKVTVHMANGEVKRGIIARLGRGDGGFTLLPQGPGKPEPVMMQAVKAVFVNAGAVPATPPPGRNVSVTFKDRRSVQGASVDVGQGMLFTLWPPGGRGGVERIIINQAECLEVR